MSTERSPTVTESTTPSDSPLPKVPSLSPNTSTSSDSSRPASQASSRTSPSVSPSPTPKSIPTIDSDECSELPTLPPTPPQPAKTLIRQAQRHDEIPRSVPSASDARPRRNREASWLSRLAYLIPTGQSFVIILGVLTFALTLIGMIFMIVFGRLTIAQTWNDAANTCAQFVTANREVGPNCQEILPSNATVDVIKPPLKYWKRVLKARLETFSNYSSTKFFQRFTLPSNVKDDAANSSFFDFAFVAPVLASTVVIGGLSLIIFRRYWRTEGVFTSPVRSEPSDWQWHHQEDSETVRGQGQGYRLIRRNPEDSHPLGQLRKYIRRSQPNAVENPTGESPWQSHNSSEETLLGPWKDASWSTSKVSLKNHTSEEKHDNLIELKTEGPKKTFFDPETGAFLHLTPWKSTGNDEVHGLRPDRKGSIRRAFAMMTLGGTGWAGGKSIDDQLAEELQASSKIAAEAGDGITDDLINKQPSGKHNFG